MLDSVHHHIDFNRLYTYSCLLDILTYVPIDETGLSRAVISYNHNIESFLRRPNILKISESIV